MGRTFQKVHACSVGNFKGTSDKIPQWIRGNGGKYMKDISEVVTHLIATKDAFQQNVDAVAQAKRLGTIKIVSYDWLEDSLLSKTKKPLRETPYLWDKILNNEIPKAQKQKSQPIRKRRKNSKAKDQNSPAGYHVYQQSKTTYTAILVRPYGVRNSRERLKLEIYESDSEPHVYTTQVKHTRIGFCGIKSLVLHGSDLEFCMLAFENYFEEQTGKKWEERLSGTSPPPRKDDVGNTVPPRKDWFYYDDETGSFSAFIQSGMASTVS